MRLGEELDLITLLRSQRLFRAIVKDISRPAQYQLVAQKVHQFELNGRDETDEMV